MRWEELRRTYMTMLTSEGFRPEIDSQGDIHFKYEGGHYYITSGCDDTYFYLLYPNFWEIDDGSELASALISADTATRSTKAAKVWLNGSGNSVSASIECLIRSPADVSSFLTRSLRCIRTAVDTFRTEMRKG